ncbi:hypothetical protein GF373_07750 [bacterium]|nr:hypothetical protein [bacterium]
MNQIPGRDWKKLRAFKEDALNLACERIFKKIDRISKEREGNEHEAYLDLWQTLNEEEKKIADMFDEIKRYNAVQKLSLWKYYNILTNEQFAQFSEETQQTINTMLEIYNGR